MLKTECRFLLGLARPEDFKKGNAVVVWFWAQYEVDGNAVQLHARLVAGSLKRALGMISRVAPNEYGAPSEFREVMIRRLYDFRQLDGGRRFNDVEVTNPTWWATNLALPYLASR